MMTRKILTAALAGLVGLSGLAMAHEGHEHKVMGKVVAVDDKTIEVLGTDGKKVTAQLSAATKYLRGKAAASRADVKVGERVVVAVVEEKGSQNAKQVLLGEANNDDQPKK
jgi:hypothetical protein